MGEILADIVEKASKGKKSVGKALEKEGNKILHQWAKARVSDKAIKLLFRELVVHWKGINR